MRLKALFILFLVLISLVPVYFVNKYLQKITRPKESFGRLFLYFFTGLILAFGYTFLLVLMIKWLFPGA